MHGSMHVDTRKEVVERESVHLNQNATPAMPTAEQTVGHQHKAPDHIDSTTPGISKHLAYSVFQADVPNLLDPTTILP